MFHSGETQHPCGCVSEIVWTAECPSTGRFVRYCSEHKPRRSRKVKRSPGGAKSPVTLLLGMVPDDWAVEHGYAVETVSRHRSYGTGGYNGPMVEHRGIRWNPGVDRERTLFHWLYGREAPANREGEAYEQFAYTGGRKVDADVLASAQEVLELPVAA